MRTKSVFLGMVFIVITSATVPALASDEEEGATLYDLKDDGGKKGGGGSGSYPDYVNFFRIDCRYHNEDHRGRDDGKDKDDKDKRGGKNRGRSDASFCYASAVYQKTDGKLRDIHLGVGCDNETIYNDRARVHVEMTLDRFSPYRAATPGVEVFPQGQLTTEGTYTSVLDGAFGRIVGLCYVHRMVDGKTF